MARTVDKGLGYTSLDVSFFQDRKIRKLQRHCGPTAPLVYIALICTIFREGYYIALDEDLICDLADETRLDDETVKKAIDSCLECNLLSREMKEKFGVLTSVGIQRQYQSICEKSKRRAGINEYSLMIPSEEMPINSEEMPINSEKTEFLPKNSEFIPQSKVKESKVKKSKEKENKENYYCSSSEQFSEEQQQQFFLSQIFFKNWGKPQEELRKFINYNNTGDRCWSRMSFEQRQAAFEFWKQTPATPPRMGEKGLALWHEVFNTLVAIRAPAAALRDALADDVDVKFGEGKILITCTKSLQNYFDANAQHFRPIFIPPDAPDRRVGYKLPQRC